MLKTFVAGIVGSIATLIVGIFTPILSWIPGKFSEINARAVFSQLETTTYPGIKTSETTSMAHCLGKNEILISGYCQINTGGGNIQNVGSADKQNFFCVYGPKADATAYAMCLRQKTVD